MTPVRLFLLTALTMTAFAANSVLNRMALADWGMDAARFGTIRLWAGAVTLVALSYALRGGMRWGGRGRALGVISLLIYIYGFSAAYLSLDAGLGALILFGFVQITMFGGALRGGERPPARRWAGAALAFAGLAWLLWPGSGAEVSLPHGIMMAAAGLGWGLYSLAGRGAGDPLVGTAANFALAAPLGLIIGVAFGDGGNLSGAGVALAILSGAVTSGLGYALWYSILPRLAASAAAVAQLTVPIIALGGGMIFLGESASLHFALASLLVLGGVAVSVLPFPKRG
ncbi:EamA-like transporter family protein [Roseivivax halotolerans]|uniref:EamA-like transporter family protein n=1 Tax=Roseivivax halotolerans TaxID=93684 RepID=A0A1I5Y192_9RHOB|nr:EamA-like transporter family protein [Roseivivax halotolerans]